MHSLTFPLDVDSDISSGANHILIQYNTDNGNNDFWNETTTKKKKTALNVEKSCHRLSHFDVMSVSV